MIRNFTKRSCLHTKSVPTIKEREACYPNRHTNTENISATQNSK